jgi:hypothetical protein
LIFIIILYHLEPTPEPYEMTLNTPLALASSWFPIPPSFHSSTFLLRAQGIGVYHLDFEVPSSKLKLVKDPRCFSTNLCSIYPALPILHDGGNIHFFFPMCVKQKLTRKCQILCNPQTKLKFYVCINFLVQIKFRCPFCFIFQ